MCVAIYGKVIEIYNADEALVEFLGTRRKVNVSLVNEVNIDDYLLIHVGFAIEKVNEEEALKTLEIFESMDLKQ
ncbi:MAG: HypC/HybG/HupF family hydrogenase formation chaperone [Clostridium sp.]|uniref:HypC/HybG/HupF family hydrogenase formation chaperone n=1 Tax=Clostridium sp. TaxID=1506 RepID=UPI003F366408